MISRNEILSSIEEARLTHVKWVGDSKKLLDGDDLEYVHAPLHCTECAFGRWFYAEWQQLSNIQIHT